MDSLVSNNKAENLFKGGGEMGALMASMDWSKNPLGPIETWPHSLRTAVSLCLSSNFPILISWGPEFIQIYNDAYRPICGDLHPKSMGQDFRICWASAMPVVGDKFFSAKYDGKGTYIKDQQMFLDRNGYLEEAFMTFSFSPILDESGQVGGIFHPITETTDAMLSARRTKVLRDLTDALAATKSMDEVASALEAKLPDCQLDIPFLLMYRLDHSTRQATRVALSGLPAQADIASPSVDLSVDENKHAWPFQKILSSHASITLADLRERFADFKAGPFEQLPHTAVLSPIWPSGMMEPFGFLVAGVSACRALDTEYRAFFDLLSSTITTAVSNVRAYEQEQKRAEELAMIDRAKTAFFSNVSHEFRTPLTLILGPLEESLADQEVPLVGRQRERQQVTFRNALRLLKLVNSLLDFSRIEAGRTQALFAPTDIAHLTEDLASVFRSTIEKAGLKFHVDTRGVSESVYLDRDMWEKIVLNILSNAFKFTLTGSISVFLKETDHSVVLEIADTGVGVPTEEVPKLFERFHRVEGSAGRTHEGTGIGLALVQELVRLHGGTISAQSTLGKGTTFTIEMPKGKTHLPQDKIQPPRSQAAASTKSAAYIEEARQWLNPTEEIFFEETPDSVDVPSTFLSKKVLLADDNKDMRQYIAKLLRPYFQVTEAGDGLAALAALKAETFDLVLTDVMMPHLDGFGLLAAIRENPQFHSLPVLMLSARAGEEARIEGIEAGADDYLCKPFSAKELLARVKTNLDLAKIRSDASQAIEKSEIKYKLVTLATRDAVWDWDLAADTVEWNEAIHTDFKYPRGVLKGAGSWWKDNIHPEDRSRVVASILSAIQNTEARWLGEYRFQRGDGQYAHVLDRGYIIKDGEGKAVRMIGAMQDITAQKNAEIEMQKARETAENASLAKSLFVANMSHEIRTPLGAMLGFAELMTDADMSAEERNTYVDTILRNGKQLSKIIDDVLDLSKIESEKLEIESLPVHLPELVRDVVGLLHLKAQEKGITLSHALDSSVPAEISTDPTRLRQILINLIGNAIKFTEKGGVEIAVRLLTENLQPLLEVSVKDSGLGITADQGKRLFEAFVQADSSMSRLYGGTGLGLVLSKKIAKAMGGDLVLHESVIGKGSTFVFTVKVDVPRLLDLRKDREALTKSPSKNLAGVQILLVEDAIDNQVLITRYLERAGAVVTLASDGAKGVETALKQKFDVVLMDIQMPHVNGYEAIAQLKAKGYAKPVLALTAHAMKSEQERCIKAGFKSHLVKPVDRYQLIETILEYVG